MPKRDSDSEEWEGDDGKSSHADEEHDDVPLGPAPTERQQVLKERAQTAIAPLPAKYRLGAKKRDKPEAEVDVTESCWECRLEIARVNDTIVFCESCERG